MPKLERRNFALRLHHLASATLGLAITLASVAVVSQPAQAQKFKVLYTFEGGADGAGAGNLIIAAGILYGAAGGGLSNGAGAGVVYKVDPASGEETVLTTFTGVRGGAANPIGALARDSSGHLYGTAANSGKGGAGGIAFEAFAKGGRTTLHSFAKGGEGDGSSPIAGVILDKKGNLYGNATLGGTSGSGAVFELNIKSRKETILYSFKGSGGDGLSPYAALIRDSSGNLYGTTEGGGTFGGTCGTNGCGTVFRVDVTGRETVLYSFMGGTDGQNPLYGALVRDSEGNLYGTTSRGGASNLGVVFKLNKKAKESVLHSFAGGADGALPYAALIRDEAGNLYGTTIEGGSSGCQSTGCGTVFKLDTTGKETVLHTFTGKKDGANAFALVRDAAGNFYGTAESGGDTTCNPPYGCGTVFKLTP
jgi:uncharacterized repeat protein (TIGR03803 family)